MEPTSSWTLVGFVTVEAQQELPVLEFETPRCWRRGDLTELQVSVSWKGLDTVLVEGVVPPPPTREPSVRPWPQVPSIPHAGFEDLSSLPFCDSCSLSSPMKGGDRWH